MAGQAGWYSAPGEYGTLRYWNGTSWTEHRQPVPKMPPAAPVLLEIPFVPMVPVSDPMAEYERQFETAPQAQLQPKFDLQQQFAPSRPSQLALLANAPAPTLIEPIPTSEDAPDELGNLAPAARGPVGTDRNRAKVLGALRGMIAGIVFVVIGLAIMGYISIGNSPGVGETKSTGIVTSLGTTAGGICTPLARFAAGGKSYTATSEAGISPCPVGLGQSVDVVYSVAAPASDARIEISTGFIQYAWLIPVLGGIVFLGSLVTFIVRAGSIAGGIALVRNGKRRSKKAVA